MKAATSTIYYVYTIKYAMPYIQPDSTLCHGLPT